MVSLIQRVIPNNSTKIFFKIDFFYNLQALALVVLKKYIIFKLKKLIF